MKTASLIILSMALIITPTVTYASSCRYDEGFLQGVSGAELKGTHTQEFMSGYLNARRLIKIKNPMYGRIGNKSPRWKNNGAGYRALHLWINKYKPKPPSGLCEICNDKPLRDAANITGVYNRDFDNWKYTCRSCNIKLDYANGRHVVKPWTDEMKLSRRILYTEKRYARTNFMSGTFHISAINGGCRT